MVGVLPLARVKSLLFGDALVSLPFAVYGGAAVVDEAARDRRCIARQRTWRATSACSTSRLRNRAATEPDWPRQDLYVTFRKALLPDVEANLLAIPRKQRAMVRKGIERGLVSEIDERRRPLLRAVCRQPAPPRHAARSRGATSRRCAARSARTARC